MATPLKLPCAFSGLVLCNLCNKLKEGACECKQPTDLQGAQGLDDLDLQKKNIQSFLDGAKALGVHDLFEVVDLHEGKHMRGVLATLHGLGIVAQDPRIVDAKGLNPLGIDNPVPFQSPFYLKDRFERIRTVQTYLTARRRGASAKLSDDPLSVRWTGTMFRDAIEKGYV